MRISRAAGCLLSVPVIAAASSAAWLPHVPTWSLLNHYAAPGAASRQAADGVAAEPARARVEGLFAAGDGAGSSSAAPDQALTGGPSFQSAQSAAQWWPIVADIAARESAAVFTAFCGGRDAAWLTTAEQEIGAEGLKRLEGLRPAGISSLPDFVAGILAGARGLSGSGWELSQTYSWRHCAPAAAPPVKILEHHD